MCRMVCVFWLLTSAAIDQSEGRVWTIPERTAWDVVRSPDGDFAFSMPARPATETRDVRGTAGMLEVLSYSCATRARTTGSSGSGPPRWSPPRGWPPSSPISGRAI